MAWGIPNYQKKNRIFSKRERELSHALRNDISSEKVFKLVEKLRDSKMRAIKARLEARTLTPSHKSTNEMMAEIDVTAEKWVNMSAEKIIKIYRQSGTEQDAAPNGGSAARDQTESTDDPPSVC